jgi:predicted nuclease of predicted toxin-antitoxin system
MDLLVDENVPHPIIHALRAAGWRLHMVSEIEVGIPDEQVMSEAEQRGFILITHDRDFGELAIRRRLPVRGVVLLELERLSLPAQVRRVLEVLTKEAAHLGGHFIVVEPDRVRRRSLPA